MIIREKTKHTIEGDSFLTVQSSVNKEKLAKLYGILSNIYRNPIGAIVREYASNAYDANIEAWNFKTLGYQDISKKYPWIREGNLKMDLEEYKQLIGNLGHTKSDSPIRLGIERVGGTIYFTVQDFGIGLSPQRMEHIYFNYLDTTKDNNDDEIGGFGIGAKSALAYTKTFHINTVYNGDEYHYIMTKGETGIPEGQLLSFIENSDKPNGTIIKVPINMSDIPQFVTECERQLRFMENVYFHNPSGIAQALDVLNHATIYSGKGWRHSDHSIKDEELSLCLNNIRYTIDWSEIGIRQVLLPISLVFNIGELQPTPSRESIVYTKDAKKLILQKIEEFYQYCADKVQKQRDNVQTIEDYFDLNQNSKNTVQNFINIDGGYYLHLSMYKAEGFGKYVKNVKMKVPAFQHLVAPGKEVSGLLKAIYNSKNVTKKDGTFKNHSYSLEYNVTVEFPFMLLRDVNTTQVSLEKCRFILENHIDNDFQLRYIRRVTASVVCDILGHNYQDVLSPEKLRHDFLEACHKFLENSSNFKGYYEDIFVNPNWARLYAAGKTRYFGGRTSSKNKNPGIYSRRYILLGRSDYMTEKLRQSQYEKKFFILYGEHSEYPKLLNMGCFLNKDKKFLHFGINSKKDLGFEIRTFAPTVYEKVKELNLPNMYTIEDLMTGKFRPLVRIATAMKVAKELDAYTPTLSIELKRYINEDIADRYKFLENYINDSLGSSIGNTFIDTSINQLRNNIYAACERLDLFDKNVLYELKVVTDYFKDLPLLAFVSINHGRRFFFADFKTSLIGYAKCRKKRINNWHYLKPEYQK